ncbi:hypothetical protein BSLG_006022 [Batrachochytrium salamandrivorans]|nr:hypothetical protein BSLG_006022 [Batrachochytrium salamandrivorans]
MSLGASTSTISQFQHAVKPTVNLMDKEIIEDGLVVREPTKLSKNGKLWLATHLLAQLVERIDAVDQLLTTAGLSHLSCSVMSPIEGVQIKEPVVSAGMTNTEPMVKERVILEGYLAVVLATGSCLAQYKWNGGQTWKGKQWNHDVYPSDAEIIMHLFCKYLDEKIMILEPHKYRGFTDKHFCHLVPSQLLYIGGVATQLLDIVAYGPIASKYDWPSKIHGNKETELLSSSQLGTVPGTSLSLPKRFYSIDENTKRLLKF